MDKDSWNALMGHVVDQAKGEVGNYQPGNVAAPGSGTGGHEGDAPGTIDYVDRGPLAVVLNEALDAKVNAGADRDGLIAEIANDGGEDTTIELVAAVLAGDLKCPPYELLASFAEQTAIDLDIIIDAAQRGGCKNIVVTGPAGLPPG